MNDDARFLDEELASTATMALAKLHTLDPFYTPLEERFERITRLASRALGVAVSAITVVQDDRQWFKSVCNWSVSELPLSKSLCREVVETGKPVIAENALDDLYLMSNPFVCNEPNFRFYAGHPLQSSEGDTIGTFCAMDVEPRQVDAKFESAFADLAHVAQDELLKTELHSAQAELVNKLGESRRQAMFDPLTHLWNRRGGMALVSRAMKDAARYDQTLGLCIADIDDFKAINDEFGHPVGDEVLYKTAGTIVRAVRPEDVVCRYGGEEFMILVRDVDARACFAIANRICAATREKPVRTRNATVPVTMSIGIAMRDRGDAVTVEQLLQAADRALYKSKRDGKDRISFMAADA